MALSKDILGQDLYDKRSDFTNKTKDELETTYGSIEAARLAACKAEAQAIIDHFKNNIQLIIPAVGLVSAAPGAPVTGVATTGTIL